MNLSLFDVDLVQRAARATAPYQPTSDTSKAAAKAIEPYIGPQGERYYAWLAQCAECGATDREAETAIPMRAGSICGRRNSLIKAGRVQRLVIDGVKQTRDGGAVWIAVLPC